MLEIKESEHFEIQINYKREVNYLSVFNGENFCSEITVKNLGPRAVNNINLTLGGYYFEEKSYEIPTIGSKKTVKIDCKGFKPSLDKLILLAEAVYSEITMRLSTKLRELDEFKIPVNIQAWNYWDADPGRYEDISSFVMPNHEYVIELIAKASRLLKESDELNSMNGYDAISFERFTGQLEALWRAITTEDIKYLTQVFNETERGQKIMTVDMIKRFKQGNCLDLSILLCSCLERLNLCPVLIFVPGHVMVGVWLNQGYVLSEAVSFDNKILSKSILDKKKSKMIVFESTLLRFDSSSITEAYESAITTIKKKKIDYVIDITASRINGIRPLPFAFSPIDLVEAEKLEIAGYKTLSAGSQRQEGWERKLLDISLRNPMLNLKPGNSFIKLQEENPDNVLDGLKQNHLTDYVAGNEKEKEEKLKHLYRGARSAIEETGANNLFLALGSLVWYDIDDGEPHTAPLIFVPANIVRKKAMTYEVRIRDDESIINVTLIEMLRQMFGVKFPELDPLPMDESGIPSWKLIFNVFEDQIREINLHQQADRQWVLAPDSYIGLFSFTKFLMWNDIHSHPAVLLNHPIIRGMVDNLYTQASFDAEDGRIPDEFEDGLMLPVEFDSSQLKAVYAAHMGSSFVVYGPPGTGKSQTITNMIADALYNGKRVLFVAEKKAALEVVETRLSKIGLAPFCLELHSNKTDKKSFFSQLSDSHISDIGKGRQKNEDKVFQERRLLLKNLSKTLEDATRALHMTLGQGVSVYEAMLNFLEKRYEELKFRYEEIKNLGERELQMLSSEIESLDIVSDLLGMHPSDSGLVGLYPKDNTIENQQALKATVEKLPETIDKASKKANGIFNRLFQRKQPHEILKETGIWKELEKLVTLDPKDYQDIDVISSKVESWKSAIDNLRKWYHFSDKVNILNNYGLPKVVDYYLKGHGGEETSEMFKTGYFKTIIDHNLDNNKNLRGFMGLMHQNKIGNYLTLNGDFQKLKRVHLIERLESNIENHLMTTSDQQQQSILLRRMMSNGRGVSLRKVISDSWEVLQVAFPCMLMSPLSVAQYIDMKTDLFDLIIFDEASQIETSDSIGVIARGNSIVVAGDPKQLPPTRFFTSRTGSGEEIEESEDADSILEDCITLGLPSFYLTRHYRSRHESLISFSNDNFYERKLLTFPSVDDTDKKLRVIDPSGIYDIGKTRTNKIEAEAVVKYIIDLVGKSEKAPSIGVVAFSKAQSNLIEDLLNMKLQRNKQLQQKLDDATEPLFIKNLENVQGDERDIIIFSIGYGPDQNGNVTLNFGPINQVGGERRLNVAVSRAREEMIVFTSLKPYHLPKEGLTGGVALLRNFLVYAMGEINLTPEEETKRNDTDTIVRQIAERLEEAGEQVVNHIGRSDFKIDLAVVDKKNPKKYKLGIILDGKNYYSLPTLRDREIVVPEVLRGLGWSLHRGWAIDWMNEPEKVMERIFDHLRRLE